MEKICAYPCWNCGELVIIENGVKPQIRIFCEGCKDDYEEKAAETKDEYIQLKMMVMWERALNTLEKQGAKMCDYYDEAFCVKEIALETPSKFQSSHEMLAAMELLRLRVKSKMQHKILNYRVDFYIPSIKVVLEIDGRLHDFKIKKDSKRDVAIIEELNKQDKGWEIIRIPTKYLEENLKQLMPAILALKKERQKLRKLNCGFLPPAYSREEAYKQSQALKGINDAAVDHINERLEELKPKEL